MEQSPTSQSTSQPTSESAPQSTPEPQLAAQPEPKPTPEPTPTPAPEPASQPGQPAIKSFADFLKSPNRIGITILGLLFTIIAGLIIAIMIIPKNSPSPRPTELGKDVILETANAIENIDDRLAYFKKLNKAATSAEDYNLVAFSCIHSIIYSPTEDRALECVDNFSYDESIANKEELLDYYYYVSHLYLHVDDDKYDIFIQKYIKLYQELHQN